MSYCRVKHCRYAATHTTVAHKCGTCGGYGHGQIECADPVAIRHLSFFFPETVAPDDQCSATLCSKRATHTTAGHTCRFCDGFSGRHLRHCPDGLNAASISITDDPLSIGFDPRPNAESQNVLPGNYIMFYGGMGCFWYARNNPQLGGTLEYFLMHSDSHGQYGDDSSDIPRLRAFTESYRMQEIRDDFANQVPIPVSVPETTTGDSVD